MAFSRVSPIYRIFRVYSFNISRGGKIKVDSLTEEESNFILTRHVGRWKTQKTPIFFSSLLIRVLRSSVVFHLLSLFFPWVIYALGVYLEKVNSFSLGICYIANEIIQGFCHF